MTLAEIRGRVARSMKSSNPTVLDRRFLLELVDRLALDLATVTDALAIADWHDRYQAIVAGARKAMKEVL